MKTINDFSNLEEFLNYRLENTQGIALVNSKESCTWNDLQSIKLPNHVFIAVIKTCDGSFATLRTTSKSVNGTPYKRCMVSTRRVEY